MTTATKPKRTTKPKAKKAATTPRPSVALSDATREALATAKLARSREIAKGWIETATPSALEGMMRDAGISDQGPFLTSTVLDAFTKAELETLAGQLGISFAASWTKAKLVAALLEAPGLALPKEFDAIRPRV